MSKNIGLELLYKIQCLYQQKLISKEEKNTVANLIQTSIKNNNYEEVKLFLNNIKIIDDKKKELLKETIDIIEKGEN